VPTDDVRFLPEVAADSACPEAPVCSNRALRDAQSTACGRGITLYAPNSANQSFSVVKYRSLFRWTWGPIYTVEVDGYRGGFPERLPDDLQLPSSLDNCRTPSKSMGGRRPSE